MSNLPDNNKNDDTNKNSEAQNPVKAALKSAADTAVKISETVSDLNDDGVVDEKDAAIARARAGELVDSGKKFVAGTWEYVKDSQLAKESAVGAVALGTVAAMLPVVSVPVGIAAGIGIAVFKWSRRP